MSCLRFRVEDDEGFDREATYGRANRFAAMFERLLKVVILRWIEQRGSCESQEVAGYAAIYLLERWKDCNISAGIVSG
jgi:hypothetical protein